MMKYDYAAHLSARENQAGLVILYIQEDQRVPVDHDPQMVLPLFSMGKQFLEVLYYQPFLQK